jgi:hypothetical protein
MLVLLYLLVFIGVFLIYRRRFYGRHLQPVDGEPGRLEYVKYGKSGRVVGYAFGVPQSGGLPFMVRRERWYDRLLKWLGLAREMQLADQSLDDQWFFVTDYPRDMKALFSHHDVRQALGGLLHAGVESLHATTQRIWCVLPSKAGEQESTRTQAMNALLSFAAALSAHRAALEVPPKRRHTRQRAFVFVGVHLVLLIAGCIGLFASVTDQVYLADISEWTVYTAIVAGMGLLLWLGAIVLWFRRTSWIGWVLTDFLISGVAGIVLFSATLTRDINVAWDTAPPIIKTMTVLEKSCRVVCRTIGLKWQSETYPLNQQQCTAKERAATLQQYRRDHSALDCSLRYTLLLRHWNDDKHRPFRANINEHTADALALGAEVQVPVRRGYLGLNWVRLGDIPAITKEQ